MGSVALACMFSDDAMRLFLREWLVFHALVGVRHFYLCRHSDASDASTRRLESQARRWAAPASMRLEQDRRVQWRGQVQFEREIHVPFYERALERARRDAVTWLGCLDIDEFAVPVGRSLPQCLDAFAQSRAGVGAVSLFWLNFGTSEIDDAALSGDPVLEQFTRRQGAPTIENFKTFARVDRTRRWGPSPHRPAVFAPGHRVHSYTAETLGGARAPGVLNANSVAAIEQRARSDLRLHHYRFGDRRYYREYKVPFFRRYLPEQIERFEAMQSVCNAVVDRTVPEHYGAALRRRLAATGVETASPIAAAK